MLRISGTPARSCWRMRSSACSRANRAARAGARPDRARRPPQYAFRRWHRPRRIHRLGQPPCLSELATASALTGRWQTALLPVAIQEDDVKSLMAARAPSDEDIGRRSSAATWPQWKATRSTPPSSCPRRAPCTSIGRLAECQPSFQGAPPHSPNQPDFADSAVDIQVDPHLRVFVASVLTQGPPSRRTPCVADFADAARSFGVTELLTGAEDAASQAN